MIKRPKPGDTEDDLLEFQRQFLAEKSKPSAHVVARPGDKRKTSDGASYNIKHEKDVVHIEDLPEEQPRTHHTPAAKKSRFKTLQEEKKQHARGPTEHPNDDVVDDLDTSTAIVLSKIIERDTRNVPVQMVSPVTLKCPVVEDQSIQVSKPTEKKKKKSLFAQRFAENPSQFGSFPSTDSSDHSMDFEMQEGVQGEPSRFVEGTGLSATFGKMEVEKIHRENEERLAKMSDAEILEEQQKLLQTLDPKLVDFLKSRKSTKPQVIEQKKVEEFDPPAPKKTKKSKGSGDTDIPVTVKKEWLNMNKIEYDKLEWMKDLPPPSAGDPKSGQQARFDFKGNILSPDADIPVNAGLHHHGDEPERAGYTLGELFQLARSSSIPQRTLALQVLSRVISQAKEGNLAELIETPVLPSILDAGVVFLLRWALDDSTPAVVLAAVAALNALLVNQADEMMLGHVFHWGQGHRVVCQAPSEPEEQGLKLPDVSDEKAEETDAEVAKKDLILALVSRMCLLQRLKYILEVTRPQVPSVVGILQILTRIARHSPTLAYQVSSCPGLLDCIVKEFLPISWKLEDITQPLSCVYGVPLSHAIVLVRTVCQSGRNITASLVSKYDLTGLLTRYLAVPVRDLNLPLAEAYKLQIECINTWKTCLCYGYTDTVYLDLYNVIVNELRTGPKIPEDDSLAETKLTALVGALETVLCVASVERRLKGFKQAQDGTCMETERSEDVPIATLNWSHVADLIQPIRILLTNWLAKIATTYHMKKTSLQIPSACLNFLITYYSRCQAQLSSSEILAVLEEMVAVYNTIIQHWNSQGFVSLRSAISQHSNILQGSMKHMEEMSCLPEYGQCTVQGQANIAVTMNTSPFNFLCSYIHLVYTLCKEHKGILTQETEQDSEAVTLPSVILQCEHLWSYLKKVAQGNIGHLQSNYFTKFEYHLQYYFLKLAMLPAHEDVLKTLNKTILHSVALFQLTGLLYGDEHLIHDLLSTVIYQPTFWQCTSDEKASVHISNLSLSESIPTQIKSATEQEIGFKQEDLEKEALANLLNIRSTYLAALQHFQKPLIQSRYLRNGVSETEFISIIPLHDGKAASIVAAILDLLQQKNIPLNKLCSLGSDGAAVMVGKKNGVGAKLREHVPHLISNHCVAHRLALAVGQAAKGIIYLTTYKDILDQLHRFYKYSSVRMDALHQIQEIYQNKTMKLCQAKDVRWLSHDQATVALRKNFKSVLTSLQREAQERNDIQAMGLSVFLHKYQFIASLMMMSDVLPHMSALSKAMQKRDAVYTTVKPLVKGTISIISRLLTIPGDFFCSTRETMENLIAEGFQLKMPTQAQENEFMENVYKKFLQNIIENLENRFPDLPLIENFGVFDMTDVTEDAIDDHGSNEIVELAEHFNLDLRKAKEEWRGVKHSIKEKQLTADACMGWIAANLAISHPVIYQIAAIGLLLPTSTADCERGFSTLNRVKTTHRSKLSNKIVNNLLAVSMQGPDIQDFQFKEAVDKWFKEKPRRCDIFKHHFMRNVDSVNSCFTSNINESLMPKDWMYMPLIELYNEYSSVRSEIQNALSTTQVVMVSSVLQWIYLLETYRPVVMNSISITMKITRIMCTFLTGNDMFLDRRVYCFLAGLLRQYCRPNLLDKIDFTQTIPGLSSFYDMYISLLQEYEAVSFGDWLFGCYIFIPLQQRHSLQYRKAIWTEYTGILRVLGVPPSKLLIPITQFLEPEETNVELLRLYFQSLIGCKLRYSWSPVPYLMAIHHVNRFMYTQDGSHKELKKSMMSAILKSNNEELKHHILHYKRVDISQDLGMEFYKELPQIRQKFITVCGGTV